MIRLEPMDDAAYERWQATSIPEFAQEKVDAGAWPESEALERSVRSYRELLPNGLNTPDHVIPTVASAFSCTSTARMRARDSSISEPASSKPM